MHSNSDICLRLVEPGGVIYILRKSEVVVEIIYHKLHQYGIVGNNPLSDKTTEKTLSLGC